MSNYFDKWRNGGRDNQDDRFGLNWSSRFAPIKHRKKDEIITPYSHWLDERSLHHALDDYFNAFTLKIDANAALKTQITKQLKTKPVRKDTLNNSDWKAVCSWVLVEYKAQTIPKHLLNDLFILFYTNIRDIKFEDRITANFSKFGMIEKLNNPTLKILTRGNHLKTMIIVRALLTHLLIMIVFGKYGADPDDAEAIKDLTDNLKEPQNKDEEPKEQKPKKDKKDKKDGKEPKETKDKKDPADTKDDKEPKPEKPEKKDEKADKPEPEDKPKGDDVEEGDPCDKADQGDADEGDDPDKDGDSKTDQDGDQDGEPGDSNGDPGDDEDDDGDESDQDSDDTGKGKPSNKPGKNNGENSDVDQDQEQELSDDGEMGDAENAGSGKNSQDTANDNIEKALAEALSRVYDTRQSNALLNETIEAARATIADIEDVLTDENEEALWAELANGNTRSLIKIDPEKLEEVKKELKTISLDMSSVKNSIKKLLDKSVSYFSAKDDIFFENILETDNIAGLMDYPLLHPKLRTLFIEDILVKDSRKVGKIDLYVDISSSMSQASGAVDEKGNTVSRLTFAKSVALKLKELDMLDNFYVFNTLVEQKGAEIIDILLISTDGCTSIKSVLNSIKQTGKNSLVLTDADDGLHDYSDKAFFIGVAGSNFSSFGPACRKQYAENQQMIVFDGHKIAIVDENGRC